MPSGESRRVPRWLIVLGGYSISILCLVWVYRGYDWAGQIPRVLATDLSWVTVAVAFNVCTYFVQGLRWALLLAPVAPVDRRHAIQSIFIGLFANEVLPLRPGEVIRCYLMRRWTGLPLEVVLSSAAIERLLDGIILIFGFAMVSYYVALPAILVQGSRVLMAAVIVLTALMTAAMFYHRRAKALIAQSRWKNVLLHVVNGVHDMGRSRTFLGVIVLSVIFMAMQMVPVWALMQGFRLDLSAWDAVVVLVVMRLGTIIPFSPGNAGTFQAAVLLALTVLKVPRDIATGYATLLFFVITVPLWIGGFIALLATRMRLDEIHKDAHEVPAAAANPK